ncbi:hypothetical protein [Mycobacterium paragordonae]|uniref:Uncharacterized protein n=1 Tax=Mycobacterium paragordonae TaxID=1389713 RepID=A0ABQ1CCH2_9MYCO|nr:hypothetical protein [Mycobacterium paragordonae]GFG82027.1 hypothetical protein MPRG_53030 [Mycobacterium paragordonae]
MTTHDQRTDMSGAYDDSQRGAYDEPQRRTYDDSQRGAYDDTQRPAYDESQPPGYNESQPTPPAEEHVQPQQQAPAAPVQHSHDVGHDQSQSSTEETLFGDADLADLRSRWAGVQAAFVDDPKDCVQKADVLVSDLVDQLTTGFAQARSRLEEQWSRGEEASTEDLRLALMHYREFFERLLAV